MGTIIKEKIVLAFAVCKPPKWVKFRAFVIAGQNFIFKRPQIFLQISPHEFVEIENSHTRSENHAVENMQRQIL